MKDKPEDVSKLMSNLSLRNNLDQVHSISSYKDQIYKDQVLKLTEFNDYQYVLDFGKVRTKK